MAFIIKIALTAMTVLSVLLTMLGLSGNTVMLFLALGYAWYVNFTSFSLEQLGIVAAIYLAGELWEFIVGYLGIKKEKVSWWSVLFIGIGTTLGALLGTAAMPVLGSLLGAMAGAFITAFIVEYFWGQDKSRAARVAWVAARNHCFGLLGKLAAGVTMAIIIIRALFS